MTLGKVWNKLSSRTMVYGGDWDSAKTTVRALTFAKMMDLGRDRIKFYQSDLYHDALWLNTELNGPMQFEWVARESGTHIGETAKLVKDDEWADSARYRFEIREDDNQKWVLDTYELVVHEGTPIEECEAAMTGAGCIYHPSPPMPVKEFNAGDWREEVPGTGKDYYDNPVKAEPIMVPPGHALTPEGGVAPFQPEIKETTQEQVNDILKLLFEPNIPTLRNDLNMEPSAPSRKEMKMDDIIRDLREKYSEAESSKEQLEEYQSNINDAIDELDTYMSDLDDLISSLDSLPEVSVYVDLDTVSFDS